MKNIVNNTIMVGNLKMSLFSFVTAVSGILIGIIFAMKVNLFAGLIITGSFFLAAYNINCVIVGKCKIWAWVLFITYLLYTASILSASFASGGATAAPAHRTASKSSKK